MSEYRIHLIRPEDADRVRSLRLAMIQRSEERRGGKECQ